MSSTLPILEVPSESSPKDTEVEYALILSQMIEVAEEDPSQLRLAIYEFARTKLVNNTLNAEAAEKDRLSKSLEAAIVGVEKFAKLRGGKRKRIVFRHGGAELSDYSRPDEFQAALRKAISEAALTPPQPPVQQARLFSSATEALSREIRRLGWQPSWFAVGLSCFAAAIVLIALMQGPSLWRNDKKTQASTTPVLKEANSASADRSGKSASSETAAQSSQRMPLPENYGVYLLNGSALLELDALDIRVPDRRIEMSTPVSVVHQTTIVDGAPRFLIYRRDLANDPLDKLEVRPLARVKRVVSFDQKGKPVFSASSPTWIIRSMAFEFRVRPVTGQPEMLLVQAKEGAAELPAGRYVLALKDKGFDFTVAGDVTDPTQCVERTDAVNGSFYSDCQQR